MYAVCGVELSEPDLARSGGADRGLARRGVPRGALAARSRLAERVRSAVHRRQPVHRRFPGRGGAQPAAGRGPRSSWPGPHPRPVLRPALRRRGRVGPGGGDHRHAGAEEPLRRPAGRDPAVVPLPPPVRAGPAQPAGQDGAGHRARAAPARELLAPGVRLGGGGDQPRAGGRRPRPEPSTSSHSTGSPTSSSGRVATVRGWMRSLGDDQIAANPLAAHCAAWAAALSGEQEPVRRWLPVHRGGAARRSAAGRDAIAGIVGGAAARRSSASTACGPCARRGPSRSSWKATPASPWYALARTAYGFSLYYSGEPPGRGAEAGRGRWPAMRRRHAGRHPGLCRPGADRGRGGPDRPGGGTGRARPAAWPIQAGPERAHRRAPWPTPRPARSTRRQGRLAQAQAEFEHALRSRRGERPGISPWPTVEILLRLAPVRVDAGRPARGGRATTRRSGCWPPSRTARRPCRPGWTGWTGGSQPAPGGVAGRAAHRAGSGGAAAAPGHVVAARDRAGAVPVAEHDQVPHPGHLPEARRLHPAGRGGAKGTTDSAAGWLAT